MLDECFASLNNLCSDTQKIINQHNNDLFPILDDELKRLIAIGKKAHQTTDIIRSELVDYGETYYEFVSALNDINKISFDFFYLKGEQCFKVVFPVFNKNSNDLIYIDEEWRTCFLKILRDKENEIKCLIDKPIIFIEHEYKAGTTPYGMKDCDNYNKHFVINLLQYNLITEDRKATLCECIKVRKSNQTNLYIVPQGLDEEFLKWYKNEYGESFLQNTFS